VGRGVKSIPLAWTTWGLKRGGKGKKKKRNGGPAGHRTSKKILGDTLRFARVPAPIQKGGAAASQTGRPFPNEKKQCKKMVPGKVKKKNPQNKSEPGRYNRLITTRIIERCTTRPKGQRWRRVKRQTRKLVGTHSVPLKETAKERRKWAYPQKAKANGEKKNQERETINIREVTKEDENKTKKNTEPIGVKVEKKHGSLLELEPQKE